MLHTGKNAVYLENEEQLKKYGTLEKCGTLGKMLLTWKSAPHLEKCGKVEKMRHTWKNAQHLEKCGTLKKNALHLEK